MADAPILVCTAGALEGQSIRVPNGGLSLGRADENEIVVKDEGVSRFHARLLYDNGSLWIQDSGSRNGVFVNGNRVNNHRALKVGDVLSLAEHRFEVQWESPSSDPSGSGDLGDGSTRRRRWFWPFS